MCVCGEAAALTCTWTYVCCVCLWSSSSTLQLLGTRRSLSPSISTDAESVDVSALRLSDDDWTRICREGSGLTRVRIRKYIRAFSPWAEIEWTHVYEGKCRDHRRENCPRCCFYCYGTNLVGFQTSRWSEGGGVSLRDVWTWTDGEKAADRTCPENLQTDMMLFLLFKRGTWCQMSWCVTYNQSYSLRCFSI